MLSGKALLLSAAMLVTLARGDARGDGQVTCDQSSPSRRLFLMAPYVFSTQTPHPNKFPQMTRVQTTDRGRASALPPPKPKSSPPPARASPPTICFTSAGPAVPRAPTVPIAAKVPNVPEFPEVRLSVLGPKSCRGIERPKGNPEWLAPPRERAPIPPSRRSTCGSVIKESNIGAFVHACLFGRLGAQRGRSADCVAGSEVSKKTSQDQSDK
ncbi:uncharacterized protein LOC127603706 isoform X1 [Hippocampus zosterae]|uniref:uncharacterized protein LOC127603706 isoform X1 n=1 Tax=Hippocampus zosterae TaxID=109293 RepID=UPI00223DA72D|nr:uncharacterized protein LOC127603706 isoform X1 [Hippocampus zosterae]